MRRKISWESERGEERRSASLGFWWGGVLKQDNPATAGGCVLPSDAFLRAEPAVWEWCFLQTLGMVEDFAVLKNHDRHHKKLPREIRVLVTNMAMGLLLLSLLACVFQWHEIWNLRCWNYQFGMKLSLKAINPYNDICLDKGHPSLRSCSYFISSRNSPAQPEVTLLLQNLSVAEAACYT